MTLYRIQREPVDGAVAAVGGRGDAVAVDTDILEYLDTLGHHVLEDISQGEAVVEDESQGSQGGGGQAAAHNARRGESAHNASLLGSLGDVIRE